MNNVVKGKPKVLVAGHLPPAVGGITSQLLTILGSQINQEFMLVPFNIGRPVKRNVTNNFGYHALVNSGLRRALVAIVTTLWHIMSFPFVVLRKRPAIIHIHTSPFLVFWETMIYVLVARLFGKACVLQFHFSFKYFYEASASWLRSVMLWVIRRTTVFIVICKEDVGFLAEKSATVRCCYLSNFIDVASFQHSVNRVRSKIKTRKEVVVFFLGGSDSIRKGFIDLLAAIREIGRPKFPVRFLMAGVPREQVELELPPELVSLCDVQDWVSGDAKIEVFARADIFVLPSYGEGMPIAILEAMASSIPVIATGVGGIPDMIADGREGHLIPPGDINSLAKVISGLAQAPTQRAEMGQKALQKALDFYDIPVGIQQLGNLYKGILQQNHSTIRSPVGVGTAD